METASSTPPGRSTLPYSPYQNAKQESFWSRVEGRLMAMLEGEHALTLDLLNQATQAWAEQEYHRAHHAEMGDTPLKRYLAGPNVGRPCPRAAELLAAFRIEITRRQRRSDGTLSLAGRRFEIPARYRHLDRVRFATPAGISPASISSRRAPAPSYAR